MNDIEPAGALGLADFLSDLRAELQDAAERASGPMKLAVEEVTVTLDVAVTLNKKGAGSARAQAKFWVVASAEAGAQIELSSQHTKTHRIQLTLSPRIEETVIGDDRTITKRSSPVNVHGSLAEGEERPNFGGDEAPRPSS